MTDETMVPSHERWARFRFGVIGGLLAAPPAERGDLRKELERLAARDWTDPVRGEPVTFGLSTIERWYYQARRSRDPVAVLRKKVRRDRGSRPSISEELRQAIHAQHRDHATWTKRLHYDNLAALAGGDRALSLPSYATVRRYMIEAGLSRSRSVKARDTEGFRRALERRETREVRSFEATHVGALFHLDFHHGRLAVVTRSGEWATPKALAVLDDHSRLACHVQWYLAETTENLVHGLCQAIQKRGLPRACLMDNGSAMVAAETKEGHGRLGMIHETTLPYSPYQNAKQESFWGPVEGRLVAMLDGVAEPTLRMLNEATQAWVEMEYNRSVHSEIGTSPLSRFLDGPGVLRESPDTERLRRAFMRTVPRRQRHSDGTVVVEGRRFEVPSRFRHLTDLTLRYASWDLSEIYLVDPVTGEPLCRLHPQDKAANADGRRRILEPVNRPPAPPAGSPGLAPLLKRLLADYAATGLPFGYLLKDEEEGEAGVLAVCR